MAPSKPNTKAQPSTPRANRQTVLDRHITRSIKSKMAASPDNEKKHTGPVPAAANADGSSPPKPTTPSPFHSPGRPKGTVGYKYGQCPKCKVGHRIRSRLNPHGTSPHKGKFRFVCSRRQEEPGSGGSCNYWTLLDSDPADDPARYNPTAGATAATAATAAVVSKGRKRKITEVDEEEEMEDDDDDSHLANLAKATPTKKRAGRMGAAAKNKNNNEQDKPQQNLGCPECMVGRLAKKCKDTFSWRDAVLVCEQRWDSKLKKMVGGCGYRMELGDRAAPGSSLSINNEDNGGIAAAAAQAANDKGNKTEDREVARQKKKALNQWTAHERQKALKDPQAAAVLAGPAPKRKKKVLVDLTEGDEELPGLPAPLGPSTSSVIGPHAPIVISDDEQEKAGGFDDGLGSEDELELAQLADQAAAIKKHSKGDSHKQQVPHDDFDDDDELALMELADRTARGKGIPDEDFDEEEELALMELADRATARH